MSPYDKRQRALVQETIKKTDAWKALVELHMYTEGNFVYKEFGNFGGALLDELVAEGAVPNVVRPVRPLRWVVSTTTSASYIVPDPRPSPAGRTSVEGLDRTTPLLHPPPPSSNISLHFQLTLSSLTQLK